MNDWILQHWVNVAGPMISLLGAAASWHWARKRMQWDAAKELGMLHADTLELLGQALMLDNDSWRRADLKRFTEMREKWERSVQERAPIIGRRAYRVLMSIENLLWHLRSEVIGMSPGGLAGWEAEKTGECDVNHVSEETREKLSKITRRISRDRRFMCR
jgi:hypothetical protein